MGVGWGSDHARVDIAQELDPAHPQLGASVRRLSAPALAQRLGIEPITSFARLASRAVDDDGAEPASARFRQQLSGQHRLVVGMGVEA